MPPGQPIDKHTGVTFIVAVVLALWLALVFLLGARGVYVRPPGLLPLPILIGFMAAHHCLSFRILGITKLPRFCFGG